MFGLLGRSRLEPLWHSAESRFVRGDNRLAFGRGTILLERWVTVRLECCDAADFGTLFVGECLAV